MGQVREVDAIETAIIETEKEIAGAAWDIEDTEALDATGDRSLEDMGDGLEGQHEAEEESEQEVEETEGEDDPDAEGEIEEKPEGDATKKAGEDETEKQTQQREPQGEPQGRVPPARLREANERARKAEADRDAERAARAEEAKKFDALQAQVATLTQLLSTQRQAPPREEPKAEPKAVPDIFEDPKGFADHLSQSFQSQLAQRDARFEQMRVENSFALAHAIHKDGFAEAMEAVNKLNAQNPEDRAVVQRIYNSPNPGEALVGWHKRNKTLALVGDDPSAYAERIRTETREALIKDPEFRKQLLADLRQEAERGNGDGSARTTTRLPRNLHRAGSNAGADRLSHLETDDSDQAVADAAWR
jgi:hypothetical protein